MKHILIRTGDKEHAIDSRNVIEIVPLVELEPPEPGKPFWAGRMSYHGQTIPVIDLCVLLTGNPCQKKFSTRIIVVQLQSQTLGLIGENVTDLIAENEIVETLPLQAILGSIL